MKQTKLKRCCRCLKSNTILKEIIYYGKLNYACSDCEKIVMKSSEVGLDGSYIMPNFKKN